MSNIYFRAMGTMTKGNLDKATVKGRYNHFFNFIFSYLLKIIGAQRLI